MAWTAVRTEGQAEKSPSPAGLPLPGPGRRPPAASSPLARPCVRASVVRPWTAPLPIGRGRCWAPQDGRRLDFRLAAFATSASPDAAGAFPSSLGRTPWTASNSVGRSRVCGPRGGRKRGWRSCGGASREPPRPPPRTVWKARGSRCGGSTPCGADRGRTRSRFGGPRGPAAVVSRADASWRGAVPRGSTRANTAPAFPRRRGALDRGGRRLRRTAMLRGGAGAPGRRARWRDDARCETFSCSARRCRNLRPKRRAGPVPDRPPSTATEDPSIRRSARPMPLAFVPLPLAAARRREGTAGASTV